MLWLERRVVGALIQAPDAERRAAITAYVDGALKVMPEALRAGVTAESLLLGAWPAVQRALGRLDEAELDAQVHRWENSKVGLIRQYVRALHSLVLFAELEMASADAR